MVGSPASATIGSPNSADNMMGFSASAVSSASLDFGFGRKHGFGREHDLGFGRESEADDLTGWPEIRWFDPGRRISHERGCNPDH